MKLLIYLPAILLSSFLIGQDLKVPGHLHKVKYNLFGLLLKIIFQLPNMKPNLRCLFQPLEGLEKANGKILMNWEFDTHHLKK